jgi:hypothetical protein
MRAIRAQHRWASSVISATQKSRRLFVLAQFLHIFIRTHYDHMGVRVLALCDGEVFYLISERIRFLDFSINRIERYQV